MNRSQVKILRVSEEALAEMLMLWQQVSKGDVVKWVLTYGNMPNDAQLVSSHFNHPVRSYEFVMYHESFPPTEHGQLIEIVDVVERFEIVTVADLLPDTMVMNKQAFQSITAGENDERARPNHPADEANERAP